jgi:hypothetical protein
LAIGFDLAPRIGCACRRRELVAVDAVAAVARQFDAIAFLGRRCARLGELARDAADLDHRQGRREGQYHRHLQEHPEEVADVVGAVLSKALGAVAAMEQESLPGCYPVEMLGQGARLACKH